MIIIISKRENTMRIYTVVSKNEVLYIELDNVDYEYLIRQCGYTYSIQRSKTGLITAASRKIPALLSSTGKQTNRYLHHDIIGKPPEGLVTDHRDRNPLNNQRSNLRFITMTENLQNKKLPISGFWGIYEKKQRSCKNFWVGNIWKNKKCKHVPGYYISAFDAAIARNLYIIESGSTSRFNVM